MIKNMIFDLGAVIINYDQKKIIDSFTNNKEEINYLFDEVFHSKEWELMDLGMITIPQMVENINKKNNNKYSELTEEFLYEWFKRRGINQEAVKIARKLKEKGYKIYVLSNLGYEIYEHFKNEEFFKICDGIVISSHEHLKKPDERIFKLILDRYSLKPEECLFIDDDDTGRSYNTANSIGIKGRRVQPNNSEDIYRLLKEYNIELI